MSVDTIAMPLPEPGAIGLPDVEQPPKGKPTTRAGRRARSEQAAATRAAKPEARPKITAPRKDNVADSVKGLHELAGALALPMMGLPATGAALAASGPDAGKAWAALATRYPAIAKVFNGGGDGVLFVSLLMAYLPVITAALAESKTPKEQRAAGQAAAMAGLASMFGAAVPEQAAPPAAEQAA